MEKLFVDLHIHTSYSDGTFTPSKLVRHARDKGLAAISITDHDITDGLTEGIKEASKLGVELVPGVELSAAMKSDESEMHILGYYINWENIKFQEKLKLFRKARERRAFHILDKLSDLGIKLSEEKLFKIAGLGSIGRLHFAKLMYEEKVVDEVQEAFEKYLGEGKPAYVPKLRLKPEEAIQMIQSVGGVPVLAHPYFGGISKAVIKQLVSKGLMGLEVWHIKHSPQSVEQFRKWAKEFDLAMTGGTDCHGEYNGCALMGKLKIGYETLLKLKELKAKIEGKNKNILT